MRPVEVARGDGPLILGQPHVGTWLPDEVRDALNQTGRALADTDWHVDRLYDGLAPDATVVRAVFHRYVIDANRDPGGESLYPEQNTTGLVPLTDFDGQAIWRAPPSAEDVADRVEAFHAPYHAALAEEVERVRARHGLAVLFDCHSIRSRIPFLFARRLPDLNIGTNGGATCAPEIEAAVWRICAGAEGYSAILNGRFKGGWTTRYYGRPEAGVHAIQLEIAQSVYLAQEVPPWPYDEHRAERLRALLRRLLSALTDLAPQIGAKR